jgi:hypothetical protein
MRIRFCPKCQSTEIELLIGGITGQCQCQKCGLTLPAFPEKDVQEHKTKPKIKK